MNRIALGCVIAVGIVTARPAGADEIIFEWEGSFPIPDIVYPPGVSLDLPVEAHPDDIIKDLDVGILIPHTWQGDLTIQLEHVDSGRFFRLLERPGQGRYGFSADNYGNPVTRELFVLDDEAANPYDVPWVPHPGIENVTGNWQPDTDPLSGFDGDTAAGLWRIWIADEGGGDIGTLERVVLRFEVNRIPGPGSPLLLVAAAALARARRRR